jgi:Fe-S-cluster containining protein
MTDATLVQIVDAALAEAVRKGGPWIACRPGCTECCIGPFPISRLDAVRLRNGLAELRERDPERAACVFERARQAVARLAPDFPGDPSTGLLDSAEAAQEKFREFAEEEPCPALDPESGLCDLYAARPLTCRTFGPAIRGRGGAVGICELCFQGAGDAEIAACAVDLDSDDLESALLGELKAATGAEGETIVAFALGRVSREER